MERVNKKLCNASALTNQSKDFVFSTYQGQTNATFPNQNRLLEFPAFGNDSLLGFPALGVGFVVQLWVQIGSSRLPFVVLDQVCASVMKNRNIKL